MPRQDFKFHHTLRVRWSECDAQGIAFYGSYIEFVEVAQSEYYRNLGIRIYDEKSRKYFDTAAVKVTLEYKSPVLIDDLIDVCLRVAKIGSTSITTNAEIYRSGEDELLLNAEIIAVDYDSDRGAKRTVPEDVRKLISHFEETGEVLPIEMFPNLMPN